jgi:hypothetical protein
MRRLALFQEQTSQLPDKLDEVLLHPVVTRLLDMLARGQLKVAKRAPEETNTNENKKNQNKKKQSRRRSTNVQTTTLDQKPKLAHGVADNINEHLRTTCQHRC